RIVLRILGSKHVCRECNLVCVAHGVGHNRHNLILFSYPSGAVECDRDLTGLTRSNGIARETFRGSATAGHLNVRDDERFISRIREDKVLLHLLYSTDVAEIVATFLPGNDRTVSFLLGHLLAVG